MLRVCIDLLHGLMVGGLFFVPFLGSGWVLLGHTLGCLGTLVIWRLLGGCPLTLLSRRLGAPDHWSFLPKVGSRTANSLVLGLAALSMVRWAR